MRSPLLLLICFGLFTSVASAQLVAPTGPLTPAEQQKKFKLPPGFEIQLVAAEPDVHKPMNLKFDARGRLWVTHSLEYPFAAADDAKARDSITIFSDLGPDGRAKKAEKFATGLNIPIGVVPLGDRSCIAWSIPNLFRFTDTDGDGKADEKTVAFGPFGFSDTHGNQNGLTRWLDGWVYACHGFNNRSEVKIGGSGDVVMKLQSGNTYRFRPDGTQIEQVSWGQVNPFGLCFDPLGNMFTADCHSRPVTMVLRDGSYQSFDKPHDGLGFAPEATHVDHGGTGIAGMAYYDATHFPAEYRDVLFVGNVITNRIHCDRIQWNHSTPWIEKVEAFVSCDDPWFRPVDIQLGPDGALYVLDFYNKIIGHYEVPLTHPERDRERGRVWRIVYKGDADQPKLAPVKDLLAASADELKVAMGDPNVNVRMQATNTLVDRFPNEAETLARQAIAKPQNAQQVASALWVVARSKGIDQKLAEQLAASEERVVRVHLLHALAEAKDWKAWHFALVRSRLADADPFVKRAATSALARHPDAGNLSALCQVMREAPEDDTQLRHAARIALRNQMRDMPEGAIVDVKLSPQDRQQVLEVAALAPQGAGATLIYEAALAGEVDAGLLAKALPVAARHIDVAKVAELIRLSKQRFEKDSATRLAVLRGMHEGLAARGIAAPGALKEELSTVIRDALAGDRSGQWTNAPISSGVPTKSPWGPQKRVYKDGRDEPLVISSLGSGEPKPETLTGVLRSPMFALPQKLTFWMCGHNGPPGAADAQRNYARLVLEDGTEVARSYPPRNDTAHPYTWDLSAHEGKTGYVEIVDQLSAAGYAWLAVGRIEPAVITVPEGRVGDYDAARADLIKLAGQLRLAPLQGEIANVASGQKHASLVRLAACDALTALEPASAVAPLASLASDAKLSASERQIAAELLGRIDRDDAHKALAELLKTAPQPVAVTIASSLAARRAGGEILLSEVRAGKASAALLREPTVIARLKSVGIEKLDEQVHELTARLGPADDRIAALIKSRREKYLAGGYSAETGKAVFAKSACAQCHKVKDVGATIAPALDGIGTRGLDRVLEDVLDPNRNVDQAFRVTSLSTEDGQVVNGFGLREEGETLVLFDSAGKPVRVQAKDVDQRSILPLSPMPANLAEQIPEEDFYHLVEFLLSQKAKE